MYLIQLDLKGPAMEWQRPKQSHPVGKRTNEKTRVVTSPNGNPVDVEQKKGCTTRPNVGTTYKDCLEFQEQVSDMKLQLVKSHDHINVCAGVNMLLGRKRKPIEMQQKQLSQEEQENWREFR